MRHLIVAASEMARQSTPRWGGAVVPRARWPYRDGRSLRTARPRDRGGCKQRTRTDCGPRGYGPGRAERRALSVLGPETTAVRIQPAESRDTISSAVTVQRQIRIAARGRVVQMSRTGLHDQTARISEPEHHFDRVRPLLSPVDDTHVVSHMCELFCKLNRNMSYLDRFVYMRFVQDKECHQISEAVMFLSDNTEPDRNSQLALRLPPKYPVEFHTTPQPGTSH